jgi:hypothetical protein
MCRLASCEFHDVGVELIGSCGNFKHTPYNSTTSLLGFQFNLNDVALFVQAYVSIVVATPLGFEGKTNATLLTCVIQDKEGGLVLKYTKLCSLK